MQCVRSNMALHQSSRRFAKLEHRGGSNPECVGQHTDVIQRDVTLSALDPPDVRARKAAFECEPLLGPASGLAEFNQVLSEQDKGVVLHGHLDKEDAKAYGFDLFEATLYDDTYYE